MRTELVTHPPDTDWFVNELYDFAPSLGITLIAARYSRYVVDLNRDPGGLALYGDGRRETTMVPLQTFGGAGIYASTADEPDAAEIGRRMVDYYAPYHARLRDLLRELKQSYPHVLLFDAHSIRRHVPSIRAQPFPDLMLGDQRGRTADPRLTAAALTALHVGGKYTVAHNDPFMGGYITRHFGQPETGVHALQLEMSQDIYCDAERGTRQIDRQRVLADHLRQLLTVLVETVERLDV